MRNLVLLFVAVIFGTSASFANTADDKVAERNAYRYDNSFIFLEEGITFAVYPDGEFDFYIDNRVTGRRNNVTFNSGFDYSPFAQYDDYGAVIQVENIPIFYDFYGRVSQVGRVDINYRNGRVNRLGGMNVFYNNRGFYDYHTGFINVYNRRYIYRPFHRFFARPALGFCFVRTTPYRRYYNPFRYTFYNPYRNNRRNTFARIGKVHRYNQVRRERSTVYRNDKRVALRNNNVRTNRTVARSNANRSTRRAEVANVGRNANRLTQKRSNNNVVKSSRSASTNRSAKINGTSTKRSEARSANSRIVRSNTVSRASQGRNVTKRTVTQTPRSRTITKSTTRYKRPQARSTQKSVQRSPDRSSNMNSRSTSSRSVSKAAPSRIRSTTARSTSTVSSRSNSTGTSRSRGRQ